MSLLRDVLRKNSGRTEPPNGIPFSSRTNIKKSYAASIRSSGGASIRSVAGSIASFYTAITGSRVPKRRRADFSQLGVPSWYRADPPPAPDMPGTEHVDHEGPFTAAHGSSLQAPDNDSEPPWLSTVLYSHGSETARHSRYFNEGMDELMLLPDACSAIPPAKVQGEVVMVLKKPKSIASLDVWCIGKAESVMELAGVPFVNLHANLWKREKGEPWKHGIDASTPFKGKFPAGTYVFPFEFPAFPRDVILELPPESTDKERVTRVALPPSCSFGSVGGFQGVVKYYVGVNLKEDSFTGVDEEYDVPFSYYPRARPLPRELSPFPFISTREDWPFRREVIGGWTLTPFGGRGRFNDEIVEVEGILGVQAPEVYGAGQTVHFGLLLWSTSSLALQTLTRPDAIDVALIRSDLYGTDVLQPRNASRRNRTLHKLAQGRIWRTDDGPPLDDEMSRLRSPPASTTKESLTQSKKKLVTPPESRRPTVSRLQQSFTADDTTPLKQTIPAGSDPALAHDGTVQIEPASGSEEGTDAPRSSSPTPSLEDLNDEEEYGDTIRMDGDVRVVQTVPPSFRYKYMGCEYILQLTISHRDYSHISPSGPGIQAETPLWVVTDPPRDPDTSSERLSTTSGLSNPSDLPVVGHVAAIGSDVIRAPSTLGEVTTKERPTWRTMKMSAF